MICSHKYLLVLMAAFFFNNLCVAETHESTEHVVKSSPAEEPALRIIFTPVTVGDDVPYFNPITGKKEWIPATSERADFFNSKFRMIKQKMETILNDPTLRKRGLLDYLFVKDVRLILKGFSQAGTIINFNPFGLKSDDELLTVLIHEELHMIAHSKWNHDGTELAKQFIMKEFEKKVPKIAERLNQGTVSGVDSKNLGCLPPKPLKECTAEHMLVNWMEMRAMERLWGKERTDSFYEGIIRDHGVYAGIYEWLRIPDNHLIVEQAVDSFGPSINRR